jgi:hypothetical protein
MTLDAQDLVYVCLAVLSVVLSHASQGESEITRLVTLLRGPTLTLDAVGRESIGAPNGSFSAAPPSPREQKVMKRKDVAIRRHSAAAVAYGEHVPSMRCT